MKKLLCFIAIITLTFVTLAHATPAPKVYVCKYIGTPGVDERLQTGQNPINVSSNAIKDYKGVGSYFNDAQGRSYVLAEDTGQPEPNVSECPQPTTPTPPTPPTPPVVPTPVTPTTPQTLSATTQTTPTEPDMTNFVGK